jgi:hypothetical protein
MAAGATVTFRVGMSSFRTVDAGRRRAAVRAIAFAGTLALAATAEVAADGARWFGIRGPHCLAGACLGPVGCPGCGLVRSVASAVQGDLAQALRFHPGGAVCAAALLCGFVAAVAAACRCDAPTWTRRLDAALPRAVLAAALLGWLLRIAQNALSAHAIP